MPDVPETNTAQAPPDLDGTISDAKSANLAEFGED